ncbi:MAG TPA: DUF481 domain-containing protein [Polyangia bacterium]
MPLSNFASDSPSRFRAPPRHRRAAGPILALAFLVAGGASAQAQNVPPPKFTYEQPPPAPVDEWVAQAKGSLLVTSGNTVTRNGLVGRRSSRRRGSNKASFDGQIAYGRSSIITPVFDPANPMSIVGLDRREDTTTNQWHSKARYDRFFTANNSGYLLGQIGADKIAGKRLMGGGQVGFSRELLKNERHTTVAEIGYDFSYESYLAPAAKGKDPTQIHSGRLFVGESFAVTPDTGLFANAEVLSNLNRENALNYDDPTSDEVAPFKDTRLLGKVGVTTRLWKKLSFAFSVTWKFDQNPAPRQLPPGAAGAMFAPTFATPFADRSDTLTEATLVFSFF